MQQTSRLKKQRSQLWKRSVVPPQTFNILEPGNCSKSNAFSHHHRETHPQVSRRTRIRGEHWPFDQWNWKPVTCHMTSPSGLAGNDGTKPFSFWDYHFSSFFVVFPYLPIFIIVYQFLGLCRQASSPYFQQMGSIRQHGWPKTSWPQRLGAETNANRSHVRMIRPQREQFTNMIKHQKELFFGCWKFCKTNHPYRYKTNESYPVFDDAHPCCCQVVDTKKSSTAVLSDSTPAISPRHIVAWKHCDYSHCCSQIQIAWLKCHWK